MATSPNYGWSEPDNSSLVKNGAQDMRTLGDAIDTSVWNVGFGQAGKNKIINGDFRINQRNFTSVAGDDYGFDRWQIARSGGTATYTPQTFTAGAAPVAGYEAINFARIAVTVGNDNCRIQQKIEDVRTFANQTVTVSFYAKGTNPSTAGNLAVLFQQDFGTGGSPSAAVNTAQQTFVLTANWTRYSLTFAIPSISGKTIGTTPNTSSLGLWIGQGSSISTDAWTLDLWGVQVEYGSKATPFQTATGTIQGELDACRRYFVRYGGNTVTEFFGTGMAYSSSATMLYVPHRPFLRTTPTLTASAASNFRLFNSTLSGAAAPTAIAADALSLTGTTVLFTGSSGLSSGNACFVQSNNTTSATLDFSAEL